jgi:O-acetyl-ADP-ribose deacetylase (regulator of RNase III)
MTEIIYGKETAGGRLEIVLGDITEVEVDAVVNAANSRLAGGGGVDGAIHRAAGAEKLQAACRKIIEERGELSAGEAVATSGFALPARKIIHAVGPVWRGGEHREVELLASAYRKSLELAADMGLQSIAFPAISCGAYGFPVEKAAETAVDELEKGLERGLVKRSLMVLFSRNTAEAFERALRKQ